jgi:hypothetical protein
LEVATPQELVLQVEVHTNLMKDPRQQVFSGDHSIKCVVTLSVETFARIYIP